MPMPPTTTVNDPRTAVNIRITDSNANQIHKAAITRDYIRQPRLSKQRENCSHRSFVNYHKQ